MQEIWRTDFQRQIYNAVRHHYHYSVSLINLTAVENSSSTACTQTEVWSYGQCLQTNCNSSLPRTCIIDRCLDILAPLSAECKLCLLINIGSNGSIGNCMKEPKTNYERSFGLMLLSKKEINASRVQGYLGDDSEARGFYQASVSLCLVWKFIQLLCHLFPYKVLIAV